MQEEMTAGAAIDSLVADKVFGWPYSGHTVDGRPFHDVRRVAAGVVASEAIPSFSTDLAAAWLVVERLVKQRITVRLTTWNGTVICVCLDTYATEIAFQNSETAPLAICLASLAAVEVKEKS